MREEVSLREITADTVRDVCNLSVRPEQVGFVAPNSVSIAQAHFEPRAWFRAVYAGERPVGFVLLRLDPAQAEYHVWRFMIDGEHQGLGYGRRAVELVVEHVRSLPGATELTLSVVPAEGSAEAFYRGLGFDRTGRSKGGEMEMRLPF